MKKILRIIGVIIILLLGGFLIYNTIKNNTKSDTQDEIFFYDMTITYDGDFHTLEVENLSSNMTVEYSSSGYDIENKYCHDLRHCNAGIYNYEAIIYEDGEYYLTLEATLEIKQKEILVEIGDIIIDKDEITEPILKMEGLVEGDELGLYVYFDENYEILYYWENKNYDVITIGGKVKKIYNIIDGVNSYGGNLMYIPTSLMPVTCKDTSLFENTVITSMSFILFGIDESYNEGNLYFTFYIVDKEFTRKKEDCTIENGKKIMIDVTDLLLNRDNDVITITDLKIYIGEGETLVFGDEDMQFSFACYESNNDIPLVRSVFNNPICSMHSIAITVEGYLYLGGE